MGILALDEARAAPGGASGASVDPGASSGVPTVAGREAKEARHGDNLRETGGHVARIAHELNKSTSLVVGSLENLEGYVRLLVEAIERQSRTGDGDARLDYAIENAPAVLDICRHGANRLTRVVDQLKAFTRPSADPKSPLDLSDILKTAATWSQQHKPDAATVLLEIPPLPRVCADFELLTEAFVNLISNALDAVSGRCDGNVVVSASEASADGQAFVEVRVRDNGPGVSPDARSRLFDPFFTTKSSSEGLGLGLAIARDTIESSGGSLALSPDPGSGAEFVARLPIA